MSTKPVRVLPRPAAPSSSADDGLLLINMALEAVAADEGAASILSQPGLRHDTPESPVSLPAEIRDMLSGTKPTDLIGAKVQFQAGNSTYTGRFFLLRRRDGPDGQPLLGLLLQRESFGADAVDLLTAEYNLSDREQEALKAIATGLTSKEIAQRMSISPNTVKSFLRIIMLKMGVASRAAIVGKLLEYTKANGGSASGK